MLANFERSVRIKLTVEYGDPMAWLSNTARLSLAAEDTQEPAAD